MAPESSQESCTVEVRQQESSKGEAAGSSDVKPTWSKLRRMGVIVILFVANVLFGTCFSMLAPFFPLEAVKKGATSFEYGMVFGIFQLAMFLFCFLWGRATFLNATKQVTIGLLLAATATFFFGFLMYIPTLMPFLLTATGLRLIEAFGSAAIRTSSASIMLMIMPENLGKAVAIVNAGYTLGMLSGPCFGGLLFAAGGFYLPFVTVGSIMIGWFVISVFVLPQIESQAEESSKKMRQMLSSASIWVDLLLITNVNWDFGVTYNALDADLEQFHMHPALQSMMFSITPTVSTIGSVFWGKMADLKMNLYLMRLFGGITVLISLILLGPVPFLPLEPSLWLTSVALVILSIGNIAKLISGNVHAIVAAVQCGLPPDLATFTLVSGSCAAATALGYFIGPTIGGVALDQVGFPWMCFAFAAGEVIIMLICSIEPLWKMLSRCLGKKVDDDAQTVVAAEENGLNWRDLLDSAI